MQATVLQCLLRYHQATIPALGPGEHHVADPLLAMLAAARLGRTSSGPVVLVVPATPEGDWLLRLARFCFGPRGPQVHQLGIAPTGSECVVIAGM
jgi:hypothetical protein